jgi:hypothetical protein
VYVWDAAPRAVYYDVALVRDGRPVHVVQTEDPWLRLPPSLKLPAGTYRLTVRPALVGDTGVALGGAIVQRTFTVARG